MSPLLPSLLCRRREVVVVVVVSPALWNTSARRHALIAVVSTPRLYPHRCPHRCPHPRPSPAALTRGPQSSSSCRRLLHLRPLPAPLKAQCLSLLHPRASQRGFKGASQGGLSEKFNGHFQTPLECTINSNNHKFKRECSRLQNAITRSGMFCQHLSQCSEWSGTNSRMSVQSNTVPRTQQYASSKLIKPKN